MLLPQASRLIVRWTLTFSVGDVAGLILTGMSKHEFPARWQPWVCEARCNVRHVRLALLGAPRTNLDRTDSQSLTSDLHQRAVELLEERWLVHLRK